MIILLFCEKGTSVTCRLLYLLDVWSIHLCVSLLSFSHNETLSWEFITDRSHFVIILYFIHSVTEESFCSICVCAWFDFCSDRFTWTLGHVLCFHWIGLWTLSHLFEYCCVFVCIIICEIVEKCEEHQCVLMSVENYLLRSVR